MDGLAVPTARPVGVAISAAASVDSLYKPVDRTPPLATIEGFRMRGPTDHISPETRPCARLRLHGPAQLPRCCAIGQRSRPFTR